MKVPTYKVPGLSIELLDQVLSHLNVAVAVFDAHGKCTYCAPYLEDLFGAAPGTLYKFVGSLTYDPDSRAKLLARIAEVQKGQGDRTPVEVPAIGKDGNPTLFEVRAFELSDRGAGAVLVVAGQRPGEAIQTHDREQMTKLAAIGQIAAGVAHEFNNVITAMLGWIQIARQKKSTPQMISSALEIIGQNAQRAKEIGFRLLGASQSDTEMFCIPVSVADIAEDVIKLLSLEMKQANIDVACRFEDAEPCLVDSTRIWQVFVNLARNAMDAMPEGGELRVSVEQRGDEVVTTFADSGAGIPQDVLGRIFEPFFTTKSKEQSSTDAGIGLGLSICRDIVEAHGGAIQVESTEGEGSRFSVVLPASTEQQSEDQTTRRSRSSIPPGVSILIVDDEPDIGDMMRTALELKAVSAVAVCSGQEALERCKEQQFDAAFIDYSMPGLSGKRLGQEIHAIQPDLPIIFMSGREVEVSPDLQMADFLKKPFDIQEIQNKLHEVLER